MSTDSATAGSDRRGSQYGTDLSAPYSLSFGQQSSWSGSNLAAQSRRATSAKGKEAALTTDASRPTFLSILFDREDYLKAISDSEDENGDGTGGEAAGFIDPRLLSHSTDFVAAGASTGSPMEVVRSRHQSPKKDRFTRHRGLTHLSNRQPMANTIRIHPNLNLHNLFGNMPFSSSVRTNNYPSIIQDAQVDNLFLPSWAMMPVSSRSDPGSLKNAFHILFRDTAALLQSGTPVEVVIETHPNIAALFNETEYNRSGVISKWAVGMVHSALLRGASSPYYDLWHRDTIVSPILLAIANKRSGKDFTVFALMYLVWYLARWMVSPSPETYEAIPEWLRPT